MPGNFANSLDLIEIEEIKGGTVILKNGGLRKILIVSGMNFALKSDAEQNLVTQAYQNFLNSLNFQLQILIHSRKVNIDKYLDMLEGQKEKEPSALLQDQISEYREFVKGFVAEYAVMQKTFFVVIPFAPLELPSKESFLGFLPFMKKGAGDKAKADAEKEALFKTNQEQLDQRVNQVTVGLRGVGLEPRVLDDEQLAELFYNFYNPETVEKKDVAGIQK